MSNHRYHVHVACVADDPLLVTTQDDVAIFFESRAFITKDLLMSSAESIGYSWRCVNAADVVLILIGSSYGKINVSGMSQLHASYTHAKAQNKPLMIFAHFEVLNNPSNDRKLLDFVGSLESQGSYPIHYFDDNTNFIELLGLTFDTLVFDRSQGWQLMSSDTLSLPAHLPPHTEELPQRDSLAQPMTTKSAHTSYLTNTTHQPTLDLGSEVLVNCTAHAFRGGSLIEVSFIIPLRWQEIVDLLTDMVMPFSEQGFGRALNKIIDKSVANQMVIRQYPNVHAISRIQIIKADVSLVLNELQLTGHIEPVGQGPLWQVVKNHQGDYPILSIQASIPKPYTLS